MKKIVAAVMLLLVLSSFSLIGRDVLTITDEPIGSSSVGSWRMFRHDTSHSGYESSIAPDRNSTKWIHATGGSVLSSPAAVDGMVFVGSSDNKTYALDERTGTVIWNYPTAGVVTSSPAVYGGRVFFGSYDKKVYALNETTGALIWSYITGGSVGSSPVVSSGTVIVGSLDGKLYAFAEATGTLQWSYSTGGSISSSPAVANGKVFFGSEDSKVYALDAATGTLIWNYTTGASVTSSPSVVGGRVFVGSSDGKVYALNEDNGLLAWSYTTGASIGSSPAVADGRVFVGSYDKKVYALNQTTGALLWSYTTGNYVFSSPAIADGKLFVGSYDNTIYALDEVTGSLVWSYLTEGSVGSSPAVSDGMVFVGSSNAKLYAFGIHDVAILNVAPSKNTAIVGETVTIDVLVKNEGNFTETFSVEVYYNTTTLSMQNPTLTDGTSTTLTFLWNTVGLPLGVYTISAEASVVQDETHTADNNFTDGNVKIIQYPKAWFTFSPSIPLANQTVLFNASASTPNGGTIVNYSWDFGDSNSGGGMIATHAYASPGDYTTTLNVTDSEGLSDQTSASVKVIWYPTAKFTYSPTMAITTESVTFDASASTPNGGTIVKYRWDFGDSKTAEGKIVNHTYNSVGNFLVTLNVTDSEGLSNLTQTMVKTHARPTPSVYYYPTYPSVGELVTFNASFSYDIDGTIVRYDWNFSDGTPLVSGQIVTHHFSAKGVFTVQLTVTDNDNIGKILSFSIGVETLTGDINLDGKVDIKDIAAVAKAFGSILGQPGYSSAVDLNSDFKVDIKDIAIAAKNFGQGT